MGIESYVMAEMLQRLEVQGAMLRPHAAAIATSLSKDEYPEARDASAELLRALDGVVNTTEILRDHVVATDGIGEMGESIGELILRARTLVVLDQLSVLHRAIEHPAARAWTLDRFGGRCPDISELVRFVRERIAQIQRELDAVPSRSTAAHGHDGARSRKLLPDRAPRCTARAVRAARRTRAGAHPRRGDRVDRGPRPARAV